jgi:protein import protein ZIM17
MCAEGFGSKESMPKPRIITPKVNSKTNLEQKFLMMYTCKICSERNAQMVSKVAYTEGMVISTCKKCKNKHLIADNKVRYVCFYPFMI